MTPLDAGGRDITLTRGQRAVADVVTRSASTIPSGYAVIRVTADAALTAARAATRRLRTLVGLPELLVLTLGRLHATHPTMYGASHAHVGITMDVGRGLFVPVIHNAGTEPPGAVAATLLRHRTTAMRGHFTEADQTGATILLSLATGDDITVNRPLVFPGHVCAVAMGGVRHRLTLTPDGAIQRRIVHVGVAYDARRTSDSAVAEFATAIKHNMESPSTLLTD